MGIFKIFKKYIKKEYKKLKNLKRENAGKKEGNRFFYKTKKKWKREREKYFFKRLDAQKCLYECIEKRNDNTYKGTKRSFKMD